MEKILLILFLILFLGRIIWRFILQQINIKHLRRHGKVIPPVFQGVIDEATLAKMVDYTYDNSRLASKENLTEDILELAILFLLLPVLVGKLAGLPLHLIWQALIFFGTLAVIGGVVGIPFDLYHTFVLEKKYGFSTITWKLWLDRPCQVRDYFCRPDGIFAFRFHGVYSLPPEELVVLGLGVFYRF